MSIDTRQPKRVVTGRHVLIALLAFFGVVFAANGAFIWLALGTFTGLQEDGSYQRGRTYQHALDAAAAQAARGWRLQLDHQVGAGGALLLEVVLRDRDGAAVDGIAVHGQLRRPADAAFDQDLTFTGQGDGRYRATVPLAGAGQWDIWLETAQHGGVPHRHRQRIWVAP
ncbi:MAG: FixH family protein [Sphingomonadales bacterium]